MHENDSERGSCPNVCAENKHGTADTISTVIGRMAANSGILSTLGGTASGTKALAAGRAVPLHGRRPC
eukprot:1971897-Amphidinium_carterae.2